MVRPRLPKSVEELAQWYMRYVSPLGLIGGFIADNLYLTRRVDLWQTNTLLFFYLIVAAGSIVVINLIQTGRLRNPFYFNVLPLLPVVAQFAFGGLFSGYISLYSRSAAISVSWIFVVGLAILLLGNERFAHFYARFRFQISMYFTVLFSFFIFYLPVVFHQIGPWMFVGAGVLSLIIIALFLRLLQRLVPELVAQNLTVIARAIAIIFVVFNIAYFTGAIPPLPLALKDAGVYHSVSKASDGTYLLSGEALPWYESYLRYNTVYHVQPGGSAYAFSAVFAPSGLSFTVFHQWQYFNETTKRWVTTDMVSFPVEGGRDGGYRGYSVKSNIAPGLWRVNVVTQYGELIGRISFSVVNSTSTLPLVETTE